MFIELRFLPREYIDVLCVVLTYSLIEKFDSFMQ